MSFHVTIKRGGIGNFEQLTKTVKQSKSTTTSTTTRRKQKRPINMNRRNLSQYAPHSKALAQAPGATNAMQRPRPRLPSEAYENVPWYEGEKGTPCDNCKQSTHSLDKCMGPLVNGQVPGCPAHNDVRHSIDQCPSQRTRSLEGKQIKLLSDTADLS
jgi:hypothetical protein